MKHTFTKAAAVAAIVAGAMFAAPVAASAYTPTPGGETSTSVVVPGGTFAFFVQDDAFVPGETVTISITGENASGASLAFVKFVVQTKALGTTTANADGGTGNVQITLPANASGTYTVVATSPSNPAGVSASVSVGTANPGGTDDLATTGANSDALLTLWIGGGALLLVGGGIAVAAAVRRNKHQADAAA